MMRILVACEFLSVYLISKVGYFNWSLAPATRDNTGQAGGLQKNIFFDIAQMHTLASKSMHRYSSIDMTMLPPFLFFIFVATID
jgi:hypothetical protein